MAARSAGIQTTGIALSNGSTITARKYAFDFSVIGAVIGAATSGNLVLDTLQRGSVLINAAVKHTAQFVFSGGSGTFKISVGIVGNATLFVAQTPDLVATAVADTTYTEGPAAVIHPGTFAVTDIVANCVSSSANVNTLTAGAAYVLAYFLNVSTPGTQI